jgi:histidyl-tRNA synthetase
MIKPSNAQGTRDFLPETVLKRNYITDVITQVFEKYGFVPLQTPALENLNTLTGKYGEEGDRLIFKVLNSGDIAASINPEDVANKYNSKLINSLSKRGLRYDLTVPFARAVVQHREQLTFPFRRYQIQAVWRADRPQKGRFREFVQCDADIIGTQSISSEADLVGIYQEVFVNLGLKDVQLRINHRKLLEALIQSLGFDISFSQFTIILDKFDKIGLEGITKELQQYDVSGSQVESLANFLQPSSFNAENLNQIIQQLKPSQALQVAENDLKSLLEYIGKPSIDIVLDLSLARGLEYYTGCIFEAIVPNSGMGSISGGGRYDNLTEVFGLKDMSGVGISFGIDRIYEILESRESLPSKKYQQPTLLFCHFDEKTQKAAMHFAKQLREEGVACFVYPDHKKLNKQLDFANKSGVDYVVIIGEQEIESKVFKLKNMASGAQIEVTINEIRSKIYG